MFFPQQGQKVSLRGKSSKGASREDVLQQTKQAREDRKRRKAESQAAIKLQVYRTTRNRGMCLFVHCLSRHTAFLFHSDAQLPSWSDTRNLSPSMQAYWRGYACRKLLKRVWSRELQAWLSASSTSNILSPRNPLLPLFHRVFRADCPEELQILHQISTDVLAAVQLEKFQPSHPGTSEEQTTVFRAIFYTTKTCSAILRAIEAQRCSQVT